MIELLNQSMFSAGIFPGHDQMGQPQQTLVVKASFAFDKNASIQQIPALPLVETQEWHAEPGKSSLKQVVETVPFKAGAEVLLQGTVEMPHPHYQVHDINLSVNAWQKPLRLFGERRWLGNQLKGKVSLPKSFSEIELTYENAFGGTGLGNNCYRANPVGKGYQKGNTDLSQINLPQIEWRDKLLKSTRQKMIPACYGPVPLQWTNKLKSLPKKAWQSLHAGQYPAIKLPLEFYNFAPSDQQFKDLFTAKEIINLTGMIKELGVAATLTLRMPGVYPEAILLNQAKSELVSLKCDTLLIDIDQKHIHYLWRTALPKKSEDYMYLLIKSNQETENAEAA